MEEKKIMKTAAENDKDKGRCIYAAPVARELIRRGFAVTDIKPNRKDHDKTVFVFKDTEDFNAVLKDALRDYAEKKAQKFERYRLNKQMRETFLPENESAAKNMPKFTYEYNNSRSSAADV